MHPMHFEPAARLPPKQKGPVQSMLQEVRETRVREGPLEVVTLQVVTRTPSRRTLSTSYKHLLTPVGERPPVRRFRLKAESSARSRAMQRLQPSKHAQLLEECGCPMRLSGTNSVFLNTTKRPGQVSKLPIDVFNGPSCPPLQWPNPSTNPPMVL